MNQNETMKESPMLSDGVSTTNEDLGNILLSQGNPDNNMDFLNNTDYLNNNDFMNNNTNLLSLYTQAQPQPVPNMAQMGYMMPTSQVQRIESYSQVMSSRVLIKSTDQYLKAQASVLGYQRDRLRAQGANAGAIEGSKELKIYYVQQLKEAMLYVGTEITDQPGKNGHPAVGVKRFAEGYYPELTIEMVCWRMVEECIDATLGVDLVDRTINDNCKRENYNSFEDRMNSMIRTLRTSKAACKSVMDPSFLSRLVEAPINEEKRKVTNKKLNGERDVQNSLGRKVIEKGLDEKKLDALPRPHDAPFVPPKGRRRANARPLPYSTTKRKSGSSLTDDDMFRGGNTSMPDMTNQMLSQGMIQYPMMPQSMSNQAVMPQGANNYQMMAQSMNNQSMVAQNMKNQSMMPQDMRNQFMMAPKINNPSMMAPNMNNQSMMPQGMRNHSMMTRTSNNQSMMPQDMSNQSMMTQNMSTLSMTPQTMSAQPTTPQNMSTQSRVPQSTSNRSKRVNIAAQLPPSNGGFQSPTSAGLMIQQNQENNVPSQIQNEVPTGQETPLQADLTIPQLEPNGDEEDTILKYKRKICDILDINRSFADDFSLSDLRFYAQTHNFELVEFSWTHSQLPKGYTGMANTIDNADCSETFHMSEVLVHYKPLAKARGDVNAEGKQRMGANLFVPDRTIETVEALGSWIPHGSY